MWKQLDRARSATVPISRAQRRYADFFADVLVYTVVLNLAVEYSDAIVIDSFTISVLAAVLLKLLLDVLSGVEHRVTHFFRSRGGVPFKIVGGITVFAILFLSKLLILEIVNLVFGDEVELGHFVEVVVLIVSMIVARKLVQLGYERLGPPQRAGGGDAT